MIFMPFFFFFLIVIFLGVFISVSSCSWLYVWLGLEINLIAFIPVIICGSNDIDSEGAIKYFLVQALGSCIILFCYFIFIRFFNYIPYINLYNYIIIFSLILKIGIFPFHHWLPQVINRVRWFVCFLLSVVQKIAPSFIICYSIYGCRRSLILLIGSLGSLFGGINGLNQRQLRIILSYSSIGHLGWILCSIYFSFYVFFYYYLVYSFISFSLIILLVIFPIKVININSFNYIPFFFFLSLSLCFLSLSGLPPFLGFYSKLLVVFYIIYFNKGLYCRGLILGSLFNLFYYLSIFFNVCITSSLKNFYNINYNIYYLNIYLLCFILCISYFGFGFLYLIF